MNSKLLGEILKQIQQETVKKDGIRQEIYIMVRKATRLSKQTIFLVHKGKLEEAEKTLSEAEEILTDLAEFSKGYPDIFYVSSVNAAFEEYAEAQIFLNLIKDNRVVDFCEINVQMDHYVLGLADVIGEFRRKALDAIRRNEPETAEKGLEIMEELYAELMNNDDLLILISGLRRKCDVARRVIEATRGDVTNELRRSSLETSIRKLQQTLQTCRKPLTRETKQKTRNKQ